MPRIDPNAPNTPLLAWLKIQIQRSWKREFKLKNKIHKLTTIENKKVEYRIQEINKQFGKIREEVEMW